MTRIRQWPGWHYAWAVVWALVAARGLQLLVMWPLDSVHPPRWLGLAVWAVGVTAVLAVYLPEAHRKAQPSRAST